MSLPVDLKWLMAGVAYRCALCGEGTIVLHASVMGACRHWTQCHRPSDDSGCCEESLQYGCRVCGLSQWWDSLRDVLSHAIHEHHNGTKPIPASKKRVLMKNHHDGVALVNAHVRWSEVCYEEAVAPPGVVWNRPMSVSTSDFRVSCMTGRQIIDNRMSVYALRKMDKKYFCIGEVLATIGVSTLMGEVLGWVGRVLTQCMPDALYRSYVVYLEDEGVYAVFNGYLRASEDVQYKFWMPDPGLEELASKIQSSLMRASASACANLRGVLGRNLTLADVGPILERGAEVADVFLLSAKIRKVVRESCTVSFAEMQRRSAQRGDGVTHCLEDDHDSLESDIREQAQTFDKTRKRRAFPQLAKNTCTDHVKAIVSCGNTGDFAEIIAGQMSGQETRYAGMLSAATKKAAGIYTSGQFARAYSM